MACSDLDKDFTKEDWEGDNCTWNWSLPKVDHNPYEVEHMVEGVIWFQQFDPQHEIPLMHLQHQADAYQG